MVLAIRRGSVLILGRGVRPVLVLTGGMISPVPTRHRFTAIFTLGPRGGRCAIILISRPARARITLGLGVRRPIPRGIIPGWAIFLLVWAWWGRVSFFWLSGWWFCCRNLHTRFFWPPGGVIGWCVFYFHRMHLSTLPMIPLDGAPHIFCIFRGLKPVGDQRKNLRGRELHPRP